MNRLVEFRNAKVDVYGVDEETELEYPLTVIILDCSVLMIDVDEFSSEHDSVKSASEVVWADTDVRRDELVKLSVTMDGIAVDCRVSIAEVDKSISLRDSVSAASEV